MLLNILLHIVVIVIYRTKAYGLNDSQEIPDTSSEGTKCVTNDNKSGICVLYYQCDKNGQVNKDGAGLIDVRFGDAPCPSMYETCCQVDEENEDEITQQPDKEISGCGWRNPDGVGPKKTVNRGEAKFGEFPWMIAVLKLLPINPQESDGGLMNMYAGGGSLIHPKVVLTAAHIITSDAVQYVARAGEWDSQNLNEYYPYQDKDVEETVKHEDFNENNLRNDIALLFLASPMKNSPNVALACLPPANYVPVSGERCYTSGWGMDQFGKQGRYQNILKKVVLPVVEHAKCQSDLRKTRLGKYFRLHKSFVCAGEKKGIDACKGDGGSPLVCPIQAGQERYVETGIVSWGVGCGGHDVPGVYVNVAIFRDWIDAKMHKRAFDTSVYTY